MTAHPSLPGRLAGPGIADLDVDRWPVRRTVRPYSTSYLTLDVDTIEAPDGTTHDRAIATPNDAIGVLAIDADDRVLLVQQYRHSVGRKLLEVPAGVMDVAGETPLETAQRELAEEADLTAQTWDVLTEAVVTPGYSTEGWTLFRATGLAAIADAERTVRHAEEADMQAWWVEFDEAIAAVRDGRISDVQTSLALLHEAARRSDG